MSTNAFPVPVAIFVSFIINLRDFLIAYSLFEISTPARRGRFKFG